ncbi:hypothetical protein SAM23877_1061 [Streptomyces ambofaciens ATCC 23877]|uniref:Uncharacterized protein n=1 Tax=Streptomyces ambofaciens (strain ATCC 23877 / 3486 / DSM 40053 / JCM 4204 / NBRC 12836 / NRRL B-2516) TaxID=278992 RepID=A0A0K2ALZ3_STRA7|nr:hypothetical protein SAM23877_1061 [Streptomyces ambofaciens ATCC 23877]
MRRARGPDAPAAPRTRSPADPGHPNDRRSLSKLSGEAPAPFAGQGRRSFRPSRRVPLRSAQRSPLVREGWGAVRSITF